MKIIDLFSGIGGFHKGFEQAGYTFDWVGFSEIDKYASAVYKHKFPKSEELGDITTIQPKRNLPDNIDILCGGFPCQAFSLAGKRLGFDDTRGTLFFEIARILRHYKDSGSPIPCFVLENVKGLLSHDNGRTFATIYGVLSDIGYTIEFQLLNTRWWLPQNRERIYIVGYIGDRGKPQVFPFTKPDRSDEEAQGTEQGSRKGFWSKDYSTALRAKESRSGCDTLINVGLNQIGTIGKDSEATRVYDANGISRTIKDGGGMGAKTGLYRVHNTQVRNPNRPSLTRICDCGSKKLYKKCCGQDGGAGHLSKNDGTTYCLDTINAQAIEVKSASIRRLTPIECCRLQGFSDDWNTYGELNGKVVEMSDTQRYKQVGNAVTVDVVQAVAEQIKKSSIFK